MQGGRAAGSRGPRAPGRWVAAGCLLLLVPPPSPEPGALRGAQAIELKPDLFQTPPGVHRQKPSDIFLTFLSRSQMALLAGKPPLLRYRLVRCVYFCISKFCKSVLCVSSAGCCETPFHAVARLCPHLCGGTGRSHSSAQTLCWGSGP